MSKKASNMAALDFEDADTTIELIGVADTSIDADTRIERVEKLVAKIIFLGQTKRRSKKEDLDEIQVAA